MTERVARVLQAPGGPATPDVEIARRLGCSRALVRKVRRDLGAESPTRNVVRRGRPVEYRTSTGPAVPPAPITPTEPLGHWPRELDRIFAPGGAASIVEEALGDLFRQVLTVEARLRQQEALPRGTRFADRRQEFTTKLLAIIVDWASTVLPVAPCPFCGADHAPTGCGRCGFTGWAPPSMADLFASLEQRQTRKHWWRKPAAELAPR